MNESWLELCGFATADECIGRSLNIIQGPDTDATTASHRGVFVFFLLLFREPTSEKSSKTCVGISRFAAGAARRGPCHETSHGRRPRQLQASVGVVCVASSPKASLATLVERVYARRQNGESFVNYVRVFPLWTGGEVTHFLGVLQKVQPAKS